MAARRPSERLAAGRRDRLVKIERRGATDTPDPDSGEPTETWTTLVAQMPAARIDLAGTERFLSDQLAAKVDVEWEIGYRCDMDPECVDVQKLRRLVVGDRVHDIVNAMVVGRRRGIVLQTLASSAVPL